MLIRFQATNFRSFKSEQTLSMVASSLAGNSEALVHFERQGLDLLRVAAIYGANAAGKSNVLAALRFISWAVANSHRSWPPDGATRREPFLLDPVSRAAPSRFEIDFLLGAIRYRYGFKLDSHRILEEWLNAYPSGRRQRWFYRTGEPAQVFEFGKSLRGNNRTISALVRPNSLFLSAAAENNHPMLLPVYTWLTSAIRYSDFRALANPAFTSDLAPLVERHKGDIVSLLKLADLGIIDVDLKEISFEPKVFDALKNLVTTIDSKATLPEPLPPVRTLEFKHAASLEDVSLPVEAESRGTLAWLILVCRILDSFEKGAVLCIDELDASLHPRLAHEVIRMFQDPERNRRNVQLIFNTHDTTLLGNQLGGPDLRRDQIWFVEKDRSGATHLYPLTDFKPRKEENRERGYLQGRYGAVPFVA